ncbi:MAG TPA: helix-turn-helix domain-containing protein [Pseudonocardiaceae bacterium]|jgi:DNA-binding HxlR family transcriptional regulator
MAPSSTRPGITVMAEQKPAPRPCSVAAALEILGERWTLLAVREMSYGVHRFDQITAFTGASRDILAARLRKLEQHGIVERRRYNEHPPRYEYHLTDAGAELVPILRALHQWGDRWAVAKPAVLFWHDCGHQLEVDQVCRACGHVVRTDDLTVSHSHEG